MKPTRIYKTKLRQNILRQMLFTNRNILLGLIVIVSIVIGFGFSFLSIEHRIIIIILTSGISITIASTKLDNQTLVTLFPRFVRYISKNKRIRF